MKIKASYNENRKSYSDGVTIIRQCTALRSLDEKLEHMRPRRLFQVARCRRSPFFECYASSRMSFLPDDALWQVSKDVFRMRGEKLLSFFLDNLRSSASFGLFALPIGKFCLVFSLKTGLEEF